MVKVSFLGACREVGRSAVLVESEKTDDRILLDYGIKMEKEAENFPDHVSGRDLTAIVVTHSHIDHVGGVPIFYISGHVPLYLTKITLDVSEVLLRDMMHISSFYLPFEKREIHKMRTYAEYLKYNNKVKVGQNSYITLLNAGHIPGSAMVLVEVDNKKILYTGDMNAIPTQLMNPAVPPADNIDLLITESTYGIKEHKPREEVEKSFINKIISIADNDGRVLVPAFGVSRSQEILMILNKYNVKYPIVVDGMARKIAKIYKSHNDGFVFRSWSEMIAAFNQSHFIKQRNRFHERKRARNTNGIIVAPSGMLKGGTARMYAESMINDPNAAIILVSYQIENSPGEILLNEGKYMLYRKNQPKKADVECDIDFYDFSSHSGMNELVDFAKKCNFTDKDKRIFTVHGEEESATGLAKNLKSLDFSATAAKQSETYKI
ncbi:MAG: MBL fold metallo-hydrolase [Candidatus Lokiarchaeota archaeon]|nr:MBL fold metallo-hydrolase [Candidatus Lokiarchaeota archaeon]